MALVASAGLGEKEGGGRDDSRLVEASEMDPVAPEGLADSISLWISGWTFLIPNIEII